MAGRFLWETANVRGTCKTLRVEKFFGGLRTVPGHITQA